MRWKEDSLVSSGLNHIGGDYKPKLVVISNSQVAESMEVLLHRNAENFQLLSPHTSDQECQ